MPKEAGQRVTWHGLHGTADALAISELASAWDGLVLIITRDSARAQRWQGAVGFFQDAVHDPLHFPDWETLPYDAFSPHQDIISERLATLTQLPQTSRGVLTVPVTTLMQRIAPRQYLDGATFDFAQGQRFDIHNQRLVLDAAGYQNVDTVTERGQYAVRGAVMDIFPMGAELPVRIDLFDDEIDSLRTFDPESQRTVERITQLQLLPAKEFPFDESAVSRFRDRWHHAFNVDVRRCSVYQDVSSHIAPNGIEYYLPFFFDNLGTLFDYLPERVLIVLEPGVIDAAQHHLSETQTRYESLSHDVERPILAPRELFLVMDELYGHLNKHPRIELDNQPGKHSAEFHSHALPDLEFNARNAHPAEKLNHFLASIDQPVLFVAESAGRREMFDELLRKAGINTHVIESFFDFKPSASHCITIAGLDEGLHVENCVVITESDVLGTRQTDPRRETSGRVLDPDQIVKNLTELSVGAPVVHIDHGVGRYLGLQTLTIDGDEYEFLTLAYADEDKLYVPVTSLHLISRYAGTDEEHAPLHRLGSEQW